MTRTRRHAGPSRSRRTWTAADTAVVDRFLRAVAAGKYPHEKASLEDCRRALGAFAVPTIYRKMLDRGHELGRPRMRARFDSGELAVLDRFARLIARGKYRTARSAGPDCQAALTRLHERLPGHYATVPVRSIHTIQHELWPRVARLRTRWFYSQWSDEEESLVERYSRALIAHEYANIRDAARACTLAINRMHAQKEGRPEKNPAEVRTMPGVADKIFDHTRRLDVRQLPYRRWTAEERRISRRWARKYLQHKQGRLRAGLDTLAEMMRRELDRLGYYRNRQACITEIHTQHKLIAPPRPRPRRATA